MAHEFRMRRLVEFADTDMAGILHFANYFRYMEAVEHAFFRSLGLRVHEHAEDGVWGFVRVHAECTYERPLRYEDEVELHLVVREKRAKSLEYAIAFQLEGADGPYTAARGSLTTVCVGRSDDGSLRAIPIPAAVETRVEVAPDR